MKKKFLALVMVCSMAFAMTACGKDDEKEVDVTIAAPDVDFNVPDIDVPDVDVSTPDVDVTANDNELSISGLVSYSIKGTDYEEYAPSTTDITKVYAEKNNLQTFAITAADATGQVNIEGQFKAQIEAVYGTNYVTYDMTYNGLTYTTYDFGTNSTVSSDINVTAYVCVKDNVVIYCEEAWATQLGSSSGDSEMVLNTVTIL